MTTAGTLYGTIQSVDTTPLGSALTVAAAIGATVLTVADVADFYESGGFLTLNGVQYAFTINEGTETVTVTPALTVAGDVDDFVGVWDNSAGQNAVCVTADILPQAADDFSEPIVAIVEAGLVQYLPIGDRNVYNGEMETCTAQERHGLWYVTSIQGRAMKTTTPVPVSGSGVPIAFLIYTAASTFTKATYPTASGIRVRVVGGGGGGAGTVSTTSSQGAAGGGGQSGGYTEGWIPISSLAASETVTVGAAGAGASGTSSGTSGGTSSFGAWATAPGGSGGNGPGAIGAAAGMTGSNPLLGAGTAPTMGIALAGNAGGVGWWNYPLALGGYGGTSPLGTVALPNFYNTTPGASTGYGAGGPGASVSGSGSPITGGSGAPGVVIVEVYA